MIPERMGQVPGRERVGAVALMHQGQGRHEPLVGQIVIEPLDLVGQQQTLINDRPATTGWGRSNIASAPARCVRTSVSSRLRMTYSFHSSMSVGVCLPRAMNTCRMIGSTSRRRAAQHAVVDRHVAPAEQRLPFLGDDLLRAAPRTSGVRRSVRGRKTVPTPYLALRRQREARFGRLGGEKLVRHLHQNAGAVAGQRIAAAGSAVGQVDQNLQARADDLVALLAANVDDKADTAGVVLLGRIVHPLPGGQTATWPDSAGPSCGRSC